MVVVLNVRPDSLPGDAQVIVSVQVDVHVLQASPEALDENVIAPTAFAIHADSYALRLHNRDVATTG